MKSGPERVGEWKWIIFQIHPNPFLQDFFSVLTYFPNAKEIHETSGISGGPKAVSGLRQALSEPIRWLPRVQAKERENHPYQVVKPCMKGPPEMNHICWI